MLEKEGRLPDAVIACVGGGSNAMGTFYEFIPDKEVRLIGCEAAGLGVDTEKNAATIANGTTGIFHGMKSLFLPEQRRTDRTGLFNLRRTGLSGNRTGACNACMTKEEHSMYRSPMKKRLMHLNICPEPRESSRPVESAHAIAYAMKLAPTMDKDKIIVVTVSGRGDKDVAAIARYRGVEIYE